MNVIGIRRIIAREGLIILAIIFLGIIVLILPNAITLKDSKAPVDLLTQKRVKITDSNNGVQYTLVIPKELDFENTYKSEADIEELLKKGTLVKKEADINKFKDSCFIAILFVYPVYLVVRFIIWAIAILRGHSTQKS